MEIRKGRAEEFPRIMEIYERARAFMAETGNPRQWGATHWPPETLIKEDLREGTCYVCEEAGEILGVFYYFYGENAEPKYADIRGDGWKEGGAYGVVHRIAAEKSRKGVGSFCLRWAAKKAGNLRIDTHGDNKVMQGLLQKLGFCYRGIVFVGADGDPRLAFEYNG